MKKISIIVPAYNEEESLPFLYERLTNLIDSITNYEFEVLCIVNIIVKKYTTNNAKYSSN